MDGKIIRLSGLSPFSRIAKNLWQRSIRRSGFMDDVEAPFLIGTRILLRPSSFVFFWKEYSQ